MLVCAGQFIIRCMSEVQARAVALRAFAAMVVAGIPVRTGGSRVGMVTFGDAYAPTWA